MGHHRSQVRWHLNDLLKTDSVFDAFCLDYFEVVYRQFANGMDRVAKTTLLLGQAEPDAVMRALDAWLEVARRSVANKAAPPSYPESVSTFSNRPLGTLRRRVSRTRGRTAKDNQPGAEDTIEYKPEFDPEGTVEYDPELDPEHTLDSNVITNLESTVEHAPEFDLEHTFDHKLVIASGDPLEQPQAGHDADEPLDASEFVASISVPPPPDGPLVNDTKAPPLVRRR